MERKYFVICQPNLVTGGPDALHQLVYYMRKIGCKAYIAYCSSVRNKCSVPLEYRQYFDDFKIIDDIVDSPEISIVCPETLTIFLKRFKFSKKYVWWLSVDFNFINRGVFNRAKYLLSYPLRYCLKFNRERGDSFNNILCYGLNKPYNFKKEMEVTHLCASHYSYSFVKKQTLKETYLLIEPISKLFIDSRKKNKDVYHHSKRENIILYNPKKNGRFLKKIIQSAPDLIFLPLQNMTKDELISIYKSAKIYIDFGFFPGAERMPKEAVLFGCLIITGRRGASNYYGDVSIDDSFKFLETDENIYNIISLIRSMLNNYDFFINRFADYRNVVINLEDNFIKALKILFINE